MTRLASTHAERSPAAQLFSRYDPGLCPSGAAVCRVFWVLARTTGRRRVKRQLILASHNANLVVDLVALLSILGPSQYYRTMVRSIHFRAGTP
jgi:hypothetical protein